MHNPVRADLNIGRPLRHKGNRVGLTRTRAGYARCSGRGADRNRTGVHGFAGRCVATPPRRRRRSSVAARRARPPTAAGTRAPVERRVGSGCGSAVGAHSFIPAASSPPASRARSSALSCAQRAAVAQLARASACHAEGRGFESHQPLPVAGPSPAPARFTAWPDSGPNASRGPARRPRRPVARFRRRPWSRRRAQVTATAISITSAPTWSSTRSPAGRLEPAR
jgi:hypothetical protein